LESNRAQPPKRNRGWRVVVLGLGVVAAAFAVGYSGRMLLSEGDDADSGGVTLERARGAPLGISRPELESYLGDGPPGAVARAPGGENCLLYRVADREIDWQFCFRDGKLVYGRALVPE
jgi:hypothetical protein